MVGDLSEMSVVDIVQVVCTERQSGRLRVRSGERTGEISFAGGEVLDASCGRLTGRNAFFEIFRWREGTFELLVGERPAARTIDSPWSHLLLEAADQLDQAGTAATPPTATPSAVDQELAALARLAGTPPRPRDSAGESLRRLIALPGIAGAIVADRGGRLLAQEGVPSANELAALCIRLHEVGGGIGGELGLGALLRVCAESKQGRLAMLASREGWAVLRFGDAADAERLMPRLEAVLA